MLLNFPIYFKINFYRRIVALQCCVSFCPAAKWISHRCTYIPSFSDFLPIWVTTDSRVEFPVLYSIFSLIMYFIQVSVLHMYQSQPPYPASPCIHIFVLCLCLYFLYFSVYFCSLPYSANRIIYTFEEAQVHEKHMMPRIFTLPSQPLYVIGWQMTEQS